MAFLENLDALLKENNMSRAELARQIGIAPSTINSWFNRSCDGVSLKILRDIAGFFNVTLESLVKDLMNTQPNNEIIKPLMKYWRAERISRKNNLCG